MKDNSNHNNYSTDEYIEAYQKQLKNNQGNSFNQDHSFFSNQDAQSPISSSDSLPDLNVSMSQVENQLISQFREYKEVKKKLDDAKRELHLSSQIQVSVDNLKELERVYSHRKKTLDQSFLDAKDSFNNEINRLKIDKERMIDENKQALQLFKQNQVIAQNDLQVEFEQNQLIKYEEMLFQFSDRLQKFKVLEDDAKIGYDDYILELEDKREASKKRFEFDCDQLTLEFNNKREDLDRLLIDKKEDVLKSVESINQSFQDQVDETQRILSEQYECLNFEFESVHNVFHMLIKSSDDDFQKQKKQSVDTLLEFSEQLDQKREVWELEKVSVLEEIDQEKYHWDNEKKRIINDLEGKKSLFTDELNKLKEAFIQEKDHWKQEQETLINNYEEKKESLVREISSLEIKRSDYDNNVINQVEKLESYDLLMHEREQEFECVRQQMLANLESQRQEKLDELELDFLEKKGKFSNQLKQLEDRQKLDFSQRLDSFEKDLSQRRRLFEEDLLNRRQKIIEECKRDQKVEFDHLLDFEKDKHMKQQKALLNQVESLKQELSNKDSLIMDEIQDYQDKIKELQDETRRMETELASIEDLTRKKVIGSYEDKYKQSMDIYKQQSQKEIQVLKTANLKLDSDLKKKDLELRNFQLQVKRLESQLNKYMLDSKGNSIEPSNQPKQKIVRSNLYKRGL